MRPASSWILVALLSLGCDGGGRPDGSIVEPDAGPTGDAGEGAIDAGDATRDAGGQPDAGGPSGPVLYPSGARHSPIAAPQVDALRAAAAKDATLDDDALMKVGDSITVSNAFLRCFDGANVDLDGRPLDAAVARFASWWSRDSQAAVVGWSANRPIAGDPTPLAVEHGATRARLSPLMFGTNDVGFRDPQTFARDVWTIADTLLGWGTIPLMSTIPPRDDSASADANVPIYNLAIRAIAQGRGVPLVDLHAELAALSDHGLGGDGVHPTVFGSGGCRLTEAGLAYGYNVRNLITLEQIDRAVRALAGEVLDPSPPRLAGAGTAVNPYLIDELPFAVMGDTRSATERGIDAYACSGADESGPALVYAFDLAAPARVHAAALSAEGADLDVHLLDGAVSADACVARDDRELAHAAAAGRWYVVVDTFVGASGEAAGEVLVLVWTD